MLTILFSIILTLLSAGACFAADLSPNSARECAICHFNWIDHFYQTGRDSDLFEFPADKVVATEMMCYSCHDGSVVDSRFKVWETNRHKTGIKPSKKVRIPDFFPLGSDGTIQCATCHSAHGVDTSPEFEGTIFLRTSNKDSAMCRMCHVGKDAGPKYGNHPVDVTTLEIPEAIISAGGKTGSRKNQIICQTCHTPHGSTSDKFLVIPNSGKGITNSALCETCHSVRPDITEKSPMRMHSHPVDIDLIKEARLPERWQNGEVPYLSEDGRINCRTCHSPHNGMGDAKLLVERNNKGSLCITCHSSKKAIINSKHNMEIASPQHKNLDGKTASETGPCGACHFMHKGSGPRMWALDLSADSEAGEVISKMCNGCHSANHTASKKLTGKISHPVGVKPSIKLTDQMPLFDNLGNKSSDGNIACATCHNVHQWDPVADASEAHSAKVEFMGVEGNLTNSFLRKRAFPSPDLCLTCHKKQGYVVDTDHDMNVTSPKSLNAKRETVKESGVCGACHSVHNAKAGKLWARTPGAGGNFIEKLCSGCHAQGSVAEEKLVGNISHPLGHRPLFNRYSTWKLPLFASDGKKDIQGTITCSTCHNVHQWDPSVPEKGQGIQIDGSGLDSFLRVPYNEKAELCSGCHNNSSVKDTKHDLGLHAPEEKNKAGEKAKNIPVCGTCHRVHRAYGKPLWARELPSLKESAAGSKIDQSYLNDNMALLCLSCHSKDKVASNRQIGAISHPLAKKVREGKDTLRIELERFYSHSTLELPLYRTDGTVATDGRITCPTCHNVHQWNPANPLDKNKDGAEGNGGNSFLRRSNIPDSGLCSICHTKKRYVFKTEHDMAVTAPDERNISGQKVSESGVCSACHLVHNGKNTYKLWAREPGEGSLMPMKLCTSCHADGGPGEKKVPKILSHPPNILALEAAHADEEGFVPLYNAEGKESSTGVIVCPTCHNPHMWSPQRGEDFGPGRNTEGNANDSFLRAKSFGNVCKNCHGKDALIRFKYFHTKVSREGK